MHMAVFASLMRLLVATVVAAGQRVVLDENKLDSMEQQRLDQELKSSDVAYSLDCEPRHGRPDRAIPFCSMAAGCQVGLRRRTLHHQTKMINNEEVKPDKHSRR